MMGFIMNTDKQKTPYLFMAAVVSLLLFFLFTAQKSYGINASPFNVEVNQEDGTPVTLKVRGDERYHWQEDTDGYTVIRHNKNFFYAKRNPAGHLIPSPHLVGKVNPKAKGLEKHLLPSAKVLSQLRAAGPNGSSESSSAPQQVSASGTIKNLVVLIQFSDHTGRTLPPKANMEVLFNATAPDPTLAPTGSVRAVYLENSYGQMELNSTIHDWVTVSNTEAYYANGNSGDSTLWQALKEALDAVDVAINFNDYDQDGDGYIDSITFIHSGYGAEWGGDDAYGTDFNYRIWSHRWSIFGNWTSNEGVKVYDYHISPGVWGTSGSAIGRIGVIAHETGHFFGLPDLYDTDSSSGQGIGSYGMMANSWGFDGTQKYPPHFSPWSKIQLEWVTPTIITQSTTYNLPAIQSSPQIYRIDQGFPNNEYLLVENRQPIGFDSKMPQGGLAIWHIDEEAGFNTEGYPGQANWPNNGNHYRVALLQADGNFNLERGHNRGDGGDVWHGAGVYEINGSTNPNTDTYQGGTVGASNNRIYNISASNSNMSFEYEDLSIQVAPPLAPTLITAEDKGNGTVGLIWQDNAENEDGFKVLRNNNNIESLSANVTEYTDLQATEGDSTYKIQAHNNSGQNTANSNEMVVNVVLPPISHAYIESTQYGSRSGSYINTQAESGLETLAEVESGGKPNKRTSRLEHVWQFANVQNTVATILTVNAFGDSGNSGNDSFEFSYSTNGSDYLPLFTYSPLDDAIRTAQLANINTNVWLKVKDSNRERGERSLDRLHIRQLFIEWNDEVNPTPPSSLNAGAISSSSITLNWQDGIGETQYTVERLNGGSWLILGTSLPANTTETQVTQLNAETTYHFRVCSFDLPDIIGCTDPVEVTTLGVNTPALDSASGYKIKGKHHVDLAWSFGASVSVFRDGAVVVNNAQNVYTDNIGNKGGGSYTYHVCESANVNNCSNSITVSF